MFSFPNGDTRICSLMYFLIFDVFILITKYNFNEGGYEIMTIYRFQVE